MRNVVWRGWPTVAIVAVEGEMGASDAMCRMWVWGMETVMIMWRGGYGDEGAAAA